jgi:hypothetical protein
LATVQFSWEKLVLNARSLAPLAIPTELQTIAKPVLFHSFLSFPLPMEFASKTTFEDVSSQTQTTLPYAEHALQDSL